MDRWFAVLCELPRTGPPPEFLLVTGEAEPPEVLRFPDKLRTAGLACRHAHSLPAAELAASLASCRVFLGHDSGPAHLASACGVPCRLLFGPTNPAVWAPQGPDVKVLTAPNHELSTIEAATVAAWVTVTLPDGALAA